MQQKRLEIDRIFCLARPIFSTNMYQTLYPLVVEKFAMENNPIIDAFHVDPRSQTAHAQMAGTVSEKRNNHARRRNETNDKWINIYPLVVEQFAMENNPIIDYLPTQNSDFS